LEENDFNRRVAFVEQIELICQLLQDMLSEANDPWDPEPIVTSIATN